MRRAQAVAMCEELEQVATLSGAELNEKTQTLPERRAAFEAIGELPRQHSRELQRRFERALERIEQALKRQRAQDTERSWTDLLAAASHVQAYRAARASGQPEDVLAELKAAAESHIAAVQRWPKGGREAVKKALERQDTGDLAAGEAALRQLCVRAEVLTEQPTPDEDQALRRDYQVQRLMQGMGQGVEVQDGQLDDLTLEWVGTGPAPQSTYAGLLARFRHCRQERLQHGSSS
jgi:hypothetical protein